MLTRNLFAGVNRAEDPSNLSDLERGHIPQVSAPNVVRRGEYFDVMVDIGGAAGHPNTREHFVEYIDLYAEDSFLARTQLTGASTRPHVTFSVRLDEPVGELRAIERCNIHGTWISKRPITVVS